MSITERQQQYLADLLARADAKWPEQRAQLTLGTLGEWFSGAAWDEAFRGVAPGRGRLAILPVFIADVEEWRRTFDIATLTCEQASDAIDALKQWGSIAALYLALRPGFYLNSAPAPDLRLRAETQANYLRDLIARAIR